MRNLASIRTIPVIATVRKQLLCSNSQSRCREKVDREVRRRDYAAKYPKIAHRPARVRFLPQAVCLKNRNFCTSKYNARLHGPQKLTAPTLKISAANPLHSRLNPLCKPRQSAQSCTTPQPGHSPIPPPSSSNKATYKQLASIRKTPPVVHPRAPCDTVTKC